MAEERQGWYPGKHIKGLLGRARGWMDDRKEAKAVDRRATDAGSAIEGFESQYDSGPDFIGPMSPRTEAKQDLMQRDAFRSLRDVMQNFDPADKDQVMNMQRLLNASGVTDSEGNPLAEDGVMGAKTLGALRGAQGFRNQADEKLAVNRFDETAYNAAGTRGIPQPQVDASGPGGRLSSYTPPRGQGGRMY